MPLYRVTRTDLVTTTCDVEAATPEAAAEGVLQGSLNTFRVVGGEFSGHETVEIKVHEPRSRSREEILYTWQREQDQVTPHSRQTPTGGTLQLQIEEVKVRITSDGPVQPEDSFYIWRP